MKRLLPALLALLSVLFLAGCDWGEVLPEVEEVLPKVEEVLPVIEEALSGEQSQTGMAENAESGMADGSIEEEEALSGKQSQTGMAENAEPGTADGSIEEQDNPSTAVTGEEPSTSNTASPVLSPTVEPSTSNTASPESEAVPELPTSNAAETVLAEDGSYDSRDDVALYLVTYQHLPDNYITKSEARALGWNGGGLEQYAPGKCIGGDTFGNREGILPKGHTYTECDIDTLGASSRGAKRIVYSEDFSIYYTGNHYESFDLLYEGGTQP